MASDFSTALLKHMDIIRQWKVYSKNMKQMPSKFSEVFSPQDAVFWSTVNEGGINTFSDIQGLKNFTSQKVTRRQALEK